ncbi:hypothetical protein L596_030925 [Steinernema carpocapsae]|uniref:SKP1 component POZ domain-containing protein n=1 Tax=Steinernema carpocapsae TaxID=34508 RepID=A0A4U5MHB5_STECR|nr:hypothetical protein L596_030925 [Steinernema carpocapsae]
MDSTFQILSLDGKEFIFELRWINYSSVLNRHISNKTYAGPVRFPMDSEQLNFIVNWIELSEQASNKREDDYALKAPAECGLKLLKKVKDWIKIERAIELFRNDDLRMALLVYHMTREGSVQS